MKIRNVNKFYGNSKVVDDVTFQLPKGKVISMIGPNGAGKSTALNMVTRLIERDGGEILLDDKDILSYKSKDLAKRLSILTQTNNINMKLTVKELIAFGRFPYSGSNLTSEDYRHVNEAMAYMELTDLKDRFIDELSGGQRQRAYIAMVIAQDTEYIFLDEPTNNLDIYHASQMMRLVRKLCDELGKTVILVLHDINFASSYSDYIIAFKDGKVHKAGYVSDVMTRETLKELYKVDFEIMEMNGKPISVYY